MTNKKAIGRNFSEHTWFWVRSLFFFGLQCRLCFCAATLVVNANVVEGNIFNIVTRDAADNRGVLWFGVIDHDVTEGDPSQRTHRRPRRATQATSQPQKNRAISNVA